MNGPSTPTSELRLLPVVQASRSVRLLPVTAAGLLTALAVGASVLLVPAENSAAAEGIVTTVPAQPAAVTPPLAHAVQPPAPAAVQPVREARDPFRPLLTPPDQATSAPAGPPSGSTPDNSTPDVGSPDLGSPDLGSPGSGGSGAERPQQPAGPQPSAPSGSGASVTSKKLALTDVQASGDVFVAVLTIDGQAVRAKVGESFGPGGQLLLLSIQQGPRDGQWTAVVQAGQGDPFDVVSGTATRIP